MRTFIRKNIKRAVVRTAYHSGLAQLFGSYYSQKIFCVAYHSISDEKNKKSLMQYLYPNISIDAKNFE